MDQTVPDALPRLQSIPALIKTITTISIESVFRNPHRLALSEWAFSGVTTHGQIRYLRATSLSTEQGSTCPTLDRNGRKSLILSSSIGNNVGIGLKIGTGNNINFKLVNSTLDYNGSWAVQNGTAPTQNAVSLVNCYIAQRSRWLQNFGYMNLSGVYANDAADSGILGYLIDNEAAFFTSLGGQFFNNGTGAILNPGGVPSTWIAPLVTSPGTGGFSSYPDLHRPSRRCRC